MMATRPGIPVLLLLLLRLPGSGAQPRPASGANVFREAAAALRGMLPEPVRETLLRYWEVAMDSANVLVSVLAELGSDLLDAVGIEGEERGSLRRALSWGLAALLVYLVLSAALRLLVSLAGRLLWLLKLAAFLLAAGYAALACEDERRRNALLLGLGGAYLLLGRLALPSVGGGHRAPDHHRLEGKVAALERQLAEVESRLRQRKLRDYD